MKLVTDLSENTRTFGEQNRARMALGLPPLERMNQRCVRCGARFVSSRRMLWCHRCSVHARAVTRGQIPVHDLAFGA